MDLRDSGLASKELVVDIAFKTRVDVCPIRNATSETQTCVDHMFRNFIDVNASRKGRANVKHTHVLTYA